MSSLRRLQDSTEDGPENSGSEPPPLVFPQLLFRQPPAACSRQPHTCAATRPEPPPPPVPPPQSFGLVHLQSLALMIDSLRLYSGLGRQSAEQYRDSSTRRPLQRLDQLLEVLVTPEARVSAMRVLLLASNPAVGRADYFSAAQGELAQFVMADSVHFRHYFGNCRHIRGLQGLCSMSRAARHCVLRRTCCAFTPVARLMSR